MINLFRRKKTPKTIVVRGITVSQSAYLISKSAVIEQRVEDMVPELIRKGIVKVEERPLKNGQVYVKVSIEI